jgi:hypothetical protein
MEAKMACNFIYEVEFTINNRALIMKLPYRDRPTNYQLATDFLSVIVASGMPLDRVHDVMFLDDDFCPLVGVCTAEQLQYYVPTLDGRPTL